MARSAPVLGFDLLPQRNVEVGDLAGWHGPASSAPDFVEEVPARHPAHDASKTELANVLDAIRQGLLTPSTRQLLETCERRVVEREAALRIAIQSPAPVTSLSTVIARYLSDLRATLSTDVEAARLLLAKLLGSVIVRKVGTHLVAEIEGNVDARF